MKLDSIISNILHEDDHYLVINKPPFIPTLDDREPQRAIKSILALAREYCPTAQVCHRLDKETSGALIIAKHPEAYRHASMQFEHRQVRKEYHAVVGGIHDFQAVEMYLPILAHRNGFAKIDRQEGKEALTFFQTLQVYKAHTLVQCMPVTGRMHQIRVHLMCLKAPIVQDQLYNGPSVFLSDIKRKFKLKTDTEELPLIQRVALHAYSILFHNIDESELNIVAPYPKDMRALLKQLEENS